MIIFGPVPSRRLGRSLGINNIPPKVCTYSCIYCQLGRTIKMSAKRREFYKPDEILKEARVKIKKAEEFGESIDYLTFVPDGEPTLDFNLGKEIKLLKSFGIKIAVITNSSLIWRTDVKEDLMEADWVSLKVDSTNEELWRRINRPHPSLQLQSIMDGMVGFSQMFKGELVTETMVVNGVNDQKEHFDAVADYLALVKPSVAYIAIPTRPPAVRDVQPPEEAAIIRAHQIFTKTLNHVEYLIGYEGDDFAFTGNVEDDLLSITAVHPMKEEAVRDYLVRAKADWSVIQKLIDHGKLIESVYEGHRFYMRRIQ
ncbi:MAG: radical SAM protein [Candidatus Kuenenia sp.]|nr:radical SAM protein [Candidatus Kuenenia hertensis]